MLTAERPRPLAGTKPHQGARAVAELRALDDEPCTAFECSPTEEPQVCLSGNHRPQRWPTGKNPPWSTKGEALLGHLSSDGLTRLPDESPRVGTSKSDVLDAARARSSHQRSPVGATRLANGRGRNSPPSRPRRLDPNPILPPRATAVLLVVREQASLDIRSGPSLSGCRAHRRRSYASTTS
jgi:hypothetical protein